MQLILSVTFPFFALVLLGFGAAWRGWLPDVAVPGLNAYVLYFALPCMLFRFGASLPVAQLIDPALMAVYATCSVLVVALTVAATCRRRVGGDGVDLKNAAFGGLVAAFPNSGFMGVPLLVALFGAHAAGPVIATLLIDLFLTSTLCLALSQAQALHAQATAGPQNWAMARTALRSLRSASTNPQPWAIGLGALCAAFSVQPPGPITQVVQMLAASASPVALFTIGAVLWRAGRHAPQRTPVRHYLPVALIKLLVHPLLVGAVGWMALKASWPVPRFGLTMITLTAALPSASNVSLLAQRYGADNGRIARIILCSTVLAFASFSAAVWQTQQWSGG